MKLCVCLQRGELVCSVRCADCKTTVDGQMQFHGPVVATLEGVSSSDENAPGGPVDIAEAIVDYVGTVSDEAGARARAKATGTICDDAGHERSVVCACCLLRA